MNPQYNLLKALTIWLGAISLPLDMYCAISFSDGVWLRGGLLLFVSMILYVIISILYFRVMEKMNDK